MDNKEYIERSEALSALTPGFFPQDVVYTEAVSIAKQIIGAAPAADVVPRAMIAEIESKIGKDIGDIVESVTSITDPDAIDGQYERMSTLEWVLDFVAELKEKYAVGE